MFTTDRHRQGLCQILFIAENRKQVLFTIAEIASFGYHPASQNFIFISNRKQEIHPDSLSGPGIKFLLLGRYHLIRHRIEKHKFHCTRHAFTCEIADRSSDGSMVSHPDKPRQIWGKHKLFTGNSSSIYLTRHHILCVGITTEIPGRKALRHTEREADLTLSIGMKLRIEKSCFSKVGT